MTPKQFRKYLDRDQACVHCGLDDDTLIPQHRVNRGMGGSKRLDKPSNIVVFCSAFNQLVESDALAASIARMAGWKLYADQDPATTPMFDSVSKHWWLLDDSFNRVRAFDVGRIDVGRH